MDSSPSPTLGLPSMLQGSEPAPRSLRPPRKDASVPMGPLVTCGAQGPWVSSLWPLGLPLSSSGLAWPAEDSQKPILLSHLGPVLDSLGQSPSIIPDCARAWVPYHLLNGAVRVLLGPGLCLGLIPPGSWEKYESPHFRQFQKKAGGGRVIQRGHGRGGLRPSWVPRPCRAPGPSLLCLSHI